LPASKPGFCAGTRDLDKTIKHPAAWSKAGRIVKAFVTPLQETAVLPNITTAGGPHAGRPPSKIRWAGVSAA
jgi:hypothetical protein